MRALPFLLATLVALPAAALDPKPEQVKAPEALERAAQLPDPTVGHALVEVTAPLPVATPVPLPENLFVAPPEFQEFARHATITVPSARAKLQALAMAIFRSPENGGLGIAYDNSRTRTVAEVWRDRKANCLSLTAFYVAACRSVGIDARFAEALGINRWRRVDGMIRYERHVVALVPSPPFGDLVADFLPEIRKGTMPVVRLSEARFMALYHSNRAVEQMDAGDLPGALDEARRSLEVDPTSGVGWNILGVMERRNGDLAKSEEAFRKALEISPNDGTACGNLEALLRVQGRPAEAAHYRELGLHVRAKDPYFNAFLAQEAFDEGRYDEARKSIAQAVKLLPQEPEFYLLQARLALVDGQTRDAVKALERAQRWANPEERERYTSKLAKLQHPDL